MSGATAGWTDFLVAAAGAAGALVGLVFVALSINLTRILALPTVPARAAETILLLAAALVGALVALVPTLSSGWLAVWLFTLALPTCAVPTVVQIRSFRRQAYYETRYGIVRLVCHQLATIPLVLSAMSLAGWLPGGLGWFALGLILCLLVSLMNAWILLVEIMR